MLKHSYSFDAFGTQWRIDTSTHIPAELKKTIQKRIESFDLVYSRFRSDSLVSTIAKKAGGYSFPEDATKLFNFYKKLYQITNGKLTPLIGDVISRAGYDAQYSFRSRTQKTLSAWDETMNWRGSHLTTTRPVTLDVGAAGKGYMVDIIANILDDQGYEEYVIDASGDLKHKGKIENKVGLENPFDTTKVIGVVDVQNKSLCASATNRRTWAEGMHHIFDPDTLQPTEDIVATWVIAEDTMVADGLATALFFSSPNVLKSEYDFEFVRMHKNGAVEYSTFFESKLF